MCSAHITSLHCTVHCNLHTAHCTQHTAQNSYYTILTRTQATNKRRIIIMDDDDDMPLPGPKLDANATNLPVLLCREQCVAEGSVVPSAQADTTSAVSDPTSSDMPALVSDSDDAVSDDDDVPMVNRVKKLSNRESQAMRYLGLLKAEDTDNGPSSRRAFQQIQIWVAASAAVVVDLVDTPLIER
jgi:hypothetical protein